MIILHPQSDAVGSRSEIFQTQRRLLKAGRQRALVRQHQRRAPAFARIVADEVFGMGSTRKGAHSPGSIAVHPLRGIAITIQASGQLEVPVTERETADRWIAPAPLVVLHPQSDAVGSRRKARQAQRRLLKAGRQRPRLSQGQSATKSLSRVIANEILGRDKRCGLRIGSRERGNYPEQPTSEQAGKPVHTIGEERRTHGALTA